MDIIFVTPMGTFNIKNYTTLTVLYISSLTKVFCMAIMQSLLLVS